MSLSAAMIESSLDLASARIVEPRAGALVAVSVMTPGRAALAGAFALACLVCVGVAWRARTTSVLDALWPFGALAPMFALIAVVAFFGRQEKAFDAAARSAAVSAGLGPLDFHRTVPLPPRGEIRVSFTKEYSSSANKGTSKVVRRYAVVVAGDPALGFTVANDRAAARAFAAKLSTVLGYAVKDEVEDDGVERLPKETPP